MATKKRKRRIDDGLARRQADMLKAIAHPVRVKILHHLADGPASAGEIAEAVGGERTNVSRHLAVLKSAGILNGHKVGLNVNYSLAVPCMLDTLTCCNRALREQLSAEAKALRCLC